MLSVALGLATALQWGIGALALRPAAREISSQTFTFWFAAYNTLILAVPGGILIAQQGLSTEALLIGLAAGVAELVALLFYARALKIGDLVTVAPLTSLEGAFAAVLGIIAGATVSGLSGIALALCVIGGLFLGLPGGLRIRAPGSAFAVASAGAFGVLLWLVGSTHTNTLVLLLVLNAFVFVVLGAVYVRELHPSRTSPRSHMMLLIAAVLSLGGLLTYAYGARHGSLPVTAVLAAQFAVPAVIGGFILHKERLTATQGGGAVVLLIGVSLLAVASS